jgi:eukaryotic-like serine/threonine-protein kinase
MDLIRKVIHEAHRRSLWQVLGIYLVGSWIGYEVVHGLTQGLALPDWVPGFAVVLFVIGLPIVLATAFVQEGLPTARRSGRSNPVDDSLVGLDGITLLDGGSAEDAGAGERRREPVESRPVRPHFLFTWQRAILGGIVAFLLLGITASSYVGLRESGIGPFGSLVAKGAIDERDRILVSEFSAGATDADLAATLTQAFRVDFAQSTMLTVVEPRSVRDALERMGRNPSDRLDAELARELALREGIKAVVVGEVNRGGAGYLLSASLVAAGDGAVLATFRENAADSTHVLAAVDRLSKKLRERIGESLRTIRSNRPLAAVTTPSLEALRKYTHGVDALDREVDDELGIALLREAIAIDSMFGMAWRKLAVAYSNSGVGRERVVEAATRAYGLRDRMTAAERDHTAAFYHMNVTRDQRAAIAAYRSLLELYPTDIAAMNNVAILYHRTGQHQEAASHYAGAIAIDSTLRNAYTNLASELMELARPDEADRLLDMFEARFGQTQTSLIRRFHLAGARRDYDAARDVAETMREVGRSSPPVRALAAYALSAIADIHGSLAEAHRLVREAAAADSARGNTTAPLMPPLWEVGRTLYQRREPDQALRKLEEALRTRPLEAYSPVSRPYLQVANFYAYAGHADRAVELLAEYERAVPADLRGNDGQSRRWVDYNLALGRGDAAAALAVARALEPEAICQPCIAHAFAVAYDMAGQTDAAIEQYERYTSAPHGERVWQDFDLAATHERLAELYAERDDSEKARLHAARFVELWSDADAELQPRVRAKQELLTRLGSDRR